MPPKSATILVPTEKPAIVLIHGFRGAPRGLEAIAQELRTANYQVYTPAVPPFAGAKPLEKVTPQAYAQYFRDYFKQHHLVRPILIGHSMGSVIAAATAQRYPEVVNDTLILLSPISTKPPRFITHLSPLINYLPPSAVDYLTTKFLFVPHDKELFRKTLKITHHCSNDQPPTKSALSDAIKFSTSYCVADFLPGLQKHLVFIAGEQDRLIGQQSTRKLAEKYDTTLKFIPKSGHLHNYETPHATAKLILKAIED